jgi:hypothetical protein
VNSRLLNTSRELKNVPIRIYIPTSPSDLTGGDSASPAGAFKVVQSLMQPRVHERMLPVSAAIRIDWEAFPQANRQLAHRYSTDYRRSIAQTASPAVPQQPGPCPSYGDFAWRACAIQCTPRGAHAGGCVPRRLVMFCGRAVGHVDSS